MPWMHLLTFNPDRFFSRKYPFRKVHSAALIFSVLLLSVPTVQAQTSETSWEVGINDQWFHYEEKLANGTTRSEEHTSELQSRPHLVCRLLLEKKKQTQLQHMTRKQQ